MGINLTYAQTDDLENTNTTTFGIKGGLNHSYVYSKHFDGYSGYEWYTGIFSDTRLSEKWSLQNELLVSSTNSKIFLEIPVVLKYSLTDKLNVFAGPKLDIGTEKGDFYRVVSPVGFSADFGIEYNFNKHFFIESRFGQGLGNDNVKLNSGGTLGHRRTFRLGVGYRF